MTGLGAAVTMATILIIIGIAFVQLYRIGARHRDDEPK